MLSGGLCLRVERLFHRGLMGSHIDIYNTIHNNSKVTLMMVGVTTT